MYSVTMKIQIAVKGTQSLLKAHNRSLSGLCIYFLKLKFIFQAFSAFD